MRGMEKQETLSPDLEEDWLIRGEYTRLLTIKAPKDMNNNA